MSRAGGRALLGMVAAAVLLAPAGLAAQGRAAARAEGRMLRDAASLEARGDLGGAERVLRELLAATPTSAGGLFALERVLRADHRLAEILPAADRYLAADPDAAGARYLKLRVLSELDSLAALEREAEAWIADQPRAAEPYREVARIYAEVLGEARALAVLRRGVDAVDDPAGLAPELGDLLVRMGRVDEAVTAWSRGVGKDGSGGQQVLRRLRQFDGDRRALGTALVDALAGTPATGGRARVAVEVALEVGLEARAAELARRVAGDLDGDARRAFLDELGRWATTARARELTLWSYVTLREATDEGPATRALDLRIAEAALAAGDTARAVSAHERLARALPEGSPERRRVLAGLIRLEAPRADPEKVGRRLSAFRGEFPGAPETDALAAAVAGALQAGGMDGRAAEVLEGVSGPQSALERAYLLLEGGDVGGGREALLDAVGGLPPSEATDVIQLAGLLERLPAGAGGALAAAAVRAHRGDGAGAARALADAAAAVPPGDRDGAARIRTVLVDAHGDAPEVAEATLALARWHADRGGDADLERAATLLEALILERPGSAVVPAARRELQRVRGRIP